jgi:hypothetical protein
MSEGFGAQNRVWASSGNGGTDHVGVDCLLSFLLLSSRDDLSLNIRRDSGFEFGGEGLLHWAPLFVDTGARGLPDNFMRRV